MNQDDTNKKPEINSEKDSSSNYASYPKLDPEDINPPQENWDTIAVGPPQSEVPQAQADSSTAAIPAESVPAASKSVKWSAELTQEQEAPHPPPPMVSQNHTARTMPAESNPYVNNPAPPPSSSVKSTVDTVKDVLGKWGKKVGETAKKTEDLAGNVWQHLKTGPSVADAAMGRIAQGTKVLAEGGYEKIFLHTFESVPEEKLQKTFACYLSTSAGPVMGTLYLSNAKLAFCSDNPLSYKVGEQTEWSYYKVVMPLHQLKAVNPSVSKGKPVEKYIQVVSVDGHEFWFMAFVNYDNAVQCLKDALLAQHLQPAS
ncbi:hypothetical protein MKW94_009292 [Papaver nudicaule]|uniref:GRAM domain-containing protein n=1 Tax=Papaver nudicaule TaxID=74823 RepID=A0AA41S1M6_PAPNU|nr:hypothetical protein [Papaver nudicaule]